MALNIRNAETEKLAAIVAELTAKPRPKLFGERWKTGWSQGVFGYVSRCSASDLPARSRHHTRV